MSTALRTYYRGANLVTLKQGLAQERRTYHFDHQGTTQCLTDTAQAVTDQFASDAWGVQIKRTGSGINRQWYIGNSSYIQMSEDIDQYYVRMRYYQSTLALWATVDPMFWTKQGLYHYGNNQPSKYIDPRGLLARKPPPKEPCLEEDCCSKSNQDWYFRTHIADHCINNRNQRGAWEDCTDFDKQQGACQPNKAHCGDILTQLQAWANACNNFCNPTTTQGYPSGYPWQAAVMCCYNQDSIEPKFCAMKCCYHNQPKDNQGARGCIRYCIRMHEEAHRNSECTFTKRPNPPKQNDWEFPFDECCAHVQTVQCLLDQYENICGIPGALAATIAQCKANQAGCSKKYSATPGT